MSIRSRLRLWSIGWYWITAESDAVFSKWRVIRTKARLAINEAKLKRDEEIMQLYCDEYHNALRNEWSEEGYEAYHKIRTKRLFETAEEYDARMRALQENEVYTRREQPATEVRPKE